MFSRRTPNRDAASHRRNGAKKSPRLTPSARASRATAVRWISRSPRSTLPMELRCSPARSASASCDKPAAIRNSRTRRPTAMSTLGTLRFQVLHNLLSTQRVVHIRLAAVTKPTVGVECPVCNGRRATSDRRRRLYDCSACRGTGRVTEAVLDALRDVRTHVMRLVDAMQGGRVDDAVTEARVTFRMATLVLAMNPPEE